MRKFFTALAIEYHSVDLDSVAFQQNDRGMRIRGALKHRVGAGTIPQIFVGGEHIGGCTEVFAAYADGSLRRHLEAVGIGLNDGGTINTGRLLPQWMHPRKSA